MIVVDAHIHGVRRASRLLDVGLGRIRRVWLESLTVDADILSIDAISARAETWALSYAIKL